VAIQKSPVRANFSIASSAFGLLANTAHGFTSKPKQREAARIPIPLFPLTPHLLSLERGERAEIWDDARISTFALRLCLGVRRPRANFRRGGNIELTRRRATAKSRR
jgi:hypothetical protein